MSSKRENVNGNSKQKKPEVKQPPKELPKKSKEKVNAKPIEQIKKENQNEVKPSETKEISINNKELKPKEEVKSQIQKEEVQPLKEMLKEQQNDQSLQVNNNVPVIPSTHQHDKKKEGTDLNKSNEEDNLPEAEDRCNHLEIEKKDPAIKPREDYLKAKMEEMNLSKDILSGITKGLNTSILSIKDGFITSQLTNIPETNKKYAYPQHKNTKSNVVRLHCIKDLKMNEASLMSNIYQLSQNLKVLENESLMNITIASTINPIEELRKKNKIQSLKDKRDLLKNRLEEIKYKIDSLVHQEHMEDGEFDKLIKENLLKYEINFEKDKAKASRKIKKLQKEAMRRQERMSNELGEKYELKANKIEHREKEEEQKKMVLIEQLRQQEKEVITKRNHMNREKFLKMKEHINNKFQSKSYAYLDLSKKYVDNENQLIEKERMKRKEIMKHMKKEELIDFNHKIALEKSRIEEEQNEKTIKLKELWAERSKLKPEYVNPFSVKLNEEKAMNEALNEEIEEQKENNRQKKKNYGRTISQPKPNPRLIIPRIERINGGANKTKRHEAKGTSTYPEILSKPMTPVSMQKIYPVKEINEIDMKSYKIAKPMKLVKLMKQKLTPCPKKTDYLSERRKENRSLKETDWEREMDKQQKKSSLKESMMTIHDMTQIMDQKIKQKNQLLRLNGGVSQLPDICEEVSALMINSIKAKLTIIDKAVSATELNPFSNEG